MALRIESPQRIEEFLGGIQFVQPGPALLQRGLDRPEIRNPLPFIDRAYTD